MRGRDMRLHDWPDTRVDEVSDGIFRVSTAANTVPGGFSFNQYLVVDDAPLLFHTGMRGTFAATHAAVASVLGDATRLRYVAFSHTEADECGALNAFLAAAPRAEPVCGSIAAMVSIG